MSWTAPRTWVTSELVTSSIMNTHVRDQFIEVAKLGGVRCYAYQAGAGQTVTAGNSNALTLDSELYDPTAMHTTTSRVTIATAGYYRIFGRSLVSSNNNGTAALTVRKDGSVLTPTVQASFATSGANFEDQWLTVATIISLAAGNYVELYGTAAGNDFLFDATQLIVEGLAAVA